MYRLPLVAVFAQIVCVVAAAIVWSSFVAREAAIHNRSLEFVSSLANSWATHHKTNSHVSLHLLPIIQVFEGGIRLSVKCFVCVIIAMVDWKRRNILSHI